MTEEDKLQLFMPLVLSSLTNAVYSCQLLKPNLNPEQAIADVMLTQHRLSEIVYGQIQQSGDRDIRLDQMLLAEIHQIQERKAELSSQPLTDEKAQEIQNLTAKAELLLKISEFLKQDQAKHG